MMEQNNNKVFIYDTLRRCKMEFQKDILDPIVKIYLCGPTVYSDSHLGHARSSITFDIISRYLRHCGYVVKLIRNYTDVGHLEHDNDTNGEDKIQKQAMKEKINPYEVVQKYINSYRSDMALLNILPPSIEPHASGYIHEQIDISSNILSKGFAYEINGSVYFDVLKYQSCYGTYGVLSGKDIHSLLQTSRSLKCQDEKKHSYDFALWKHADEKHIMHWPSPWGDGYPGWHTECVVLAHKLHGGILDIHGGGIDLQFPHHEAEIAQARVAFDHELSKLWVHNNLVTINGQKMSKSLNNFITLKDLFFREDNIFKSTFDPMVLKFLFLQTHYRSPLEISSESLHAAKKGYVRLENAMISLQNMHYDVVENNNTEKKDLDTKIKTLLCDCYNYMNDDFNTPLVLANIFELVNIINSLEKKQISFCDMSKECFNYMKEKLFIFVYDILGFKMFRENELIGLIVDIYKSAKKRLDYDEVDMIRRKLQDHRLRCEDIKDNVVIKYD